MSSVCLFFITLPHIMSIKPWDRMWYCFSYLIFSTSGWLNCKSKHCSVILNETLDEGISGQWALSQLPGLSSGLGRLSYLLANTSTRWYSDGGGEIPALFASYRYGFSSTHSMSLLGTLMLYSGLPLVLIVTVTIFCCISRMGSPRILPSVP